MRVGYREMGFLVIVLSVLLISFLVWAVDTMVRLSQESCTCGDVCGMVYFETPTLFYAGLGFSALILFFGVYVAVKGDSLARKDVGAAWEKNRDSLSDPDEEKTYSLIMESGGTIFQSEIAEKTGLSKVKVTRVLDRLESRRLVERRRRGMVNVVVLK